MSVDLRAAIDARLGHIEAREPGLHALVPEVDRRSRLRREVATLPPGPLHGWFLGVKDILHADGLATRAGTDLPPALFDARPDLRGDADCVAALRGAGCLVLGKTVTTEFAYFEPGPTTNPHDPAHTPGGSSSGSAAAVAAGYCELALGTQTVGSVIRPAAFCGVVGFKPSYGRVATGGLLLCAPSVDTIGFFAAHVNAVGAGASVVLTQWDAAATGEARPVLGIPEGPYLAQASAAGLCAFQEQMAALRTAGWEVRGVPALEDIDAVNARHGDLQAAEMAAEHAAWWPAHHDRYRPRTRQILERGAKVGAACQAAARDGRLRLRTELHAAMATAGVDLWVCPAAPGPAPRGLETTGDPVMNLPWTHAGLPAVSLPAGRVGGLPVGLQCVARFGADEELLAWAVSLAAALTAVG